MYKQEKSNLAARVIQESFHFWWKKEGFLAKNLHIFLTNNFDYVCHTFSKSCVTREDRGVEKMMLGVDSKPLGIFSSFRTQTGPWFDTAS